MTCSPLEKTSSSRILKVQTVASAFGVTSVATSGTIFGLAGSLASMSVRPSYMALMTW